MQHEELKEVVNMDFRDVLDMSSPEKYIGILMNNLANSNFEDAIKAYFRFCLRSYQDMACCNDPASLQFFEAIKIYSIDPILIKYNDNIKDYLNATLFLSIANEVKTETENDALEDAYWIEKYGLDVLIKSNNENKIPKVMKSSNEWKFFRLESINQSIKDLEESKT